MPHNNSEKVIVGLLEIHSSYSTATQSSLHNIAERKELLCIVEKKSKQMKERKKTSSKLRKLLSFVKIQ